MTKISKIVSQTNEYNRLQSLINNIENAIENLGKPKEKENVDFGCTTLSGWSLGNPSTGGLVISSGGNIIETINITLSPDVTALIAEDLKEMLKFKLNALKAQQEALEV